jgi:hypothetical protein
MQGLKIVFPSGPQVAPFTPLPEQFKAKLVLIDGLRIRQQAFRQLFMGVGFYRYAEWHFSV